MQNIEPVREKRIIVLNAEYYKKLDQVLGS